jgi:hypothetical protein
MDRPPLINLLKDYRDASGKVEKLSFMYELGKSVSSFANGKAE